MHGNDCQGASLLSESPREHGTALRVASRSSRTAFSMRPSIKALKKGRLKQVTRAQCLKPLTGLVPEHMNGYFKNNLKIAHLNINSIYGKVNEVLDLLNTYCQFDILLRKPKSTALYPVYYSPTRNIVLFAGIERRELEEY